MYTGTDPIFPINLASNPARNVPCNGSLGMLLFLSFTCTTLLPLPNPLYRSFWILLKPSSFCTLSSIPDFYCYRIQPISRWWHSETYTTLLLTHSETGDQLDEPQIGSPWIRRLSPPPVRSGDPMAAGGQRLESVFFFWKAYCLH